MTNKIFTAAGLVLGALMMPSAQADEAAIKQALTKAMPTLQIDSIKPSELSGVYEVTMGGSILYASEDGRYILQGHLLDVEAKKDLTEDRLSAVRKTALDKMSEDQMIIFKAKEPKYQITVFTDIDCGYCRKLHAEINDYAAQGITVRYVFFPRAGKGSESYKKAVSVWCAKDRNAALTAAKKDEAVEAKTCTHPVDKHMELGEDFSVRGTPMIVTGKGNVFPGYVPAEQLAKALAEEAKSN